MAEWSVPGYSAVRELGSGGFGRVMLARHDGTGTLVAIKYLRGDLVADEGFAEMFRGEAAVLASLADPNIVRLYEYVESPAGAAIVMELVDGVSVREILKSAGATTAEAALVVLQGSLLGLDAAHRRGVVHRDYKPENVLVNGEGVSKLTDFGIAARAGDRAIPAGTLHYAAPEQMAGAPASPASDVYSATATFYECLTGSPPFTGGAAQLLYKHSAEPVPLEPVPEPLRPLVAEGMAKDPRWRPGDAGSFLTKLRTAAGAYGPDWAARGRSHLGEAALLLAALWPSAAAPASQGPTVVRLSLRRRAGTQLQRLGKIKATIAAGAIIVIAAAAVIAITTTRSKNTSGSNLTSGPAIAYVTSSATGTVTPIRLAAGTAGAPIKLGTTSAPDAIAITPDGTIAYVAEGSSNTVTPIRLATGTPSAPIRVGRGPDAIAITPDGATAYVVNNGSNTVTPINLATGTPGAAISVGRGPDAIAITPDGTTAYVVNSGSNTVTPIDLASGAPGAPITVGRSPDAIAITPDGKAAYVANSVSNTVTPINLRDGTAGTPIPVGSGPAGIAITPDGKTAYVTNNFGGTVTPISLPGGAPGKAIPVGAMPAAIVITPDGKTAYVMAGGGEGNGMVTPIHLAARTLGTATAIGSPRVGAGYFAIAITRGRVPSPSAATMQVTVSAGGGWVDTGIKVSAGDVVTIRARGRWTPDGVNFTGPNGFGNSPTSADNYFNLADLGACPYCATTHDANWSALIGYTGSSPPAPGSYTSTTVAAVATRITLVGGSFSASWRYSGELWLGFNDDAYSGNVSDNSGQVTANITVQHP